MSKPTQLSKRTTAQLMADCIELHQEGAFNGDKIGEVTLTKESAAKLIPILQRFIGVRVSDRQTKGAPVQGAGAQVDLGGGNAKGRSRG